MRERALRILDSYATLLLLLLANFFLLEVVHDERWAVIGSTLLGAAALVVAISDPDTGHTVERRHWISIAICVLIAPVVLVVNSQDQYFSFVTITTLGFGDLSPAVGLPQALTALEALLGSVFLVTPVARLVTLWVRQDEAASR
jgi:uncharacterized membrane protein